MRQSWPGRVPVLRTRPAALAPFLPAAVESMDLSAYDVVVSSSVMFAKGVVTRTRTRHISYCYSPSRMLWDRNAEYERRGPLSRLARHWLRMWDANAAKRPDVMLAISGAVAGRIAKYYRRQSEVLHPPLLAAPTDRRMRSASDLGYYLAVGRLLPHKNFGMLVDAFAKLNRPLVIVGDGPERARLARRAPANVHFVSADDRTLASWFAGCRALIVPNEEDFGMTPVEAMSFGRPVLALRAGGALETVSEGVTGEFFDDAIPEALAEGVIRLEAGRYDGALITAHATKFNASRFDARMKRLVSCR
ncbi:MAG TPA: glycosyltransferase [Candidatus Paceibacterota bacterium]|nr:glycosyltransferase [Candidatus Paceibacterota bacterium]